MNLVIADSANKKFHPYISATDHIETFICNNINAINRKNKTFLTVQRNVDIGKLEARGFTMDQGMFDRLVLEYNKDLQSGEKGLDLWIRN